ncbi:MULTISPECIES: hypothetical protein [unclassified Aureimonas]|uniref:hypothetical protein n=1 Tax=unclassified Aureimonas TaxID=2615206 RepID=UPI0006FADCCF|nr:MULTISPECIES: hypothetical protein [unclassified Aureimonas]KQT60548.1 hypothetical protein ASG62_07870 [Aureimonas sp. Leaf427]KQT79424.1 hypothetical protein ASG54_10465 [Aureimonas sp. Leaf460]
MSDELLKGFEAEAVAIKRRELTKDEKTAIGEEMLKGALKPNMDRRKRKNAIRTAVESVGRRGSSR